jgi:hypothetical protein
MMVISETNVRFVRGWWYHLHGWGKAGSYRPLPAEGLTAFTLFVATCEQANKQKGKIA